MNKESLKKNTLTKRDLANYISISCGLQPAKASEAVEAFVEVITKSCLNGERVVLQGFGTLSGVKTPPRILKGFSQEFKVGERTRVVFKMSRVLKAEFIKRDRITGVRDINLELRKSFRKF